MTARPGANRRLPLLVAKLAIADLRSEGVLTLCTVLSLTAVVAPLLLLLGLKHGVVENQMQVLIENPVYRQITPLRTQELAPEWFGPLAARDDVEFVVPNILRGASSVGLTAGGGRPVLMDLLPSGPGDPLLVQNGARPPEPDEIVLSNEAARLLGVAAGGQVTMVFSRGGRQPQSLNMTVSGVASARADALPRAYADFALVEDVETWRGGRPVEERGWPGEPQRPVESFDAVLVASATALEDRDIRQLRSSTGLLDVTALSQADAAAALGVLKDAQAGAIWVYQFAALGELAKRANLASLSNRVRNSDVDAVLAPVVAPITASVVGLAPMPTEIMLTSVALALEEAARFGVVVPADAPPRLARDAPWSELSKVHAPAALGLRAGDDIRLRIQFPTYVLDLTLPVAGVHEADALLLSPTLHAMLRSGKDRRLAEAPVRGLEMVKDGFRGFRVYARSIEDVASLSQWFIDQGIEVVDAAQDIAVVQQIERALNRLFFFVALIGLSGGILAMIASLYASVERKRASIGVMRLLGLSRMATSGVPVVQSLFIGGAATIFACGLFLLFAKFVNVAFAADLGLGQRLAWLPLSHLAIAFALSFLVSLLSSVIAAARASRVDPADAIRVE
jgi:putative ABC transport system permease protein